MYLFTLRARYANKRALRKQITDDVALGHIQLHKRQIELPLVYKELKAVMRDPAKNRTPEAKLKFVFADVETHGKMSKDHISTLLRQCSVTNAQCGLLINTNISHEQSKALSMSNQSLDQATNCNDAQQQESRVIDNARHPAFTAEYQRMSMQELSRQFGVHGIDETTGFVQYVYSTNFDTDVLNGNFKRFGLKCDYGQFSLSPLNLWKNILPHFPSHALDILYPALLPKSALVGKNHSSLPDTQEEWHLVELACILSDPVEERDLDYYIQLGLPVKTIIPEEDDTDISAPSEESSDSDSNMTEVRTPGFPRANWRDIPIGLKCYVIDAKESRHLNYLQIVSEGRKKWGLPKKRLYNALLKHYREWKQECGTEEVEEWRNNGRQVLELPFQFKPEHAQWIIRRRKLDHIPLAQVRDEFLAMHTSARISISAFHRLYDSWKDKNLEVDLGNHHSFERKRNYSAPRHNWTPEQEKYLLEWMERSRHFLRLVIDFNQQFGAEVGEATMRKKIKELNPNFKPEFKWDNFKWSPIHNQWLTKKMGEEILLTRSAMAREFYRDFRLVVGSLFFSRKIKSIVKAEGKSRSQEEGYFEEEEEDSEEEEGSLQEEEDFQDEEEGDLQEKESSSSGLSSVENPDSEAEAEFGLTSQNRMGAAG